MIVLLILADDLTGGLDTGVQFAQKGIPTCVVTDSSMDFHTTAGDCQVLVVVTETRHLSAPHAYAIVYEIVSNAAAQGIPCIYKKTDSALRGNIGAELTAVLDASGAKILPFLPSLPASGRTTRGGVHYVEGIPVSDSPFGRDPFNPVRESDVAKLLHQQSEVCISVGDCSHIPDRDGLWVLDAETDNDLKLAGIRLRDMQMLRVCAGCAGFASQLPGLLELTSCKTPQFPQLKSGLLMLCGSVNPITQLQLDWAEEHGFERLHLSVEQKLETGYFDTQSGQAMLDIWRQKIAASPFVILDANDVGGQNAECTEYIATHCVSVEAMRHRICCALGEILSRVLEDSTGKTLMITGGDTLMQCMNRLGVHQMEPLLEISPGVVLSACECGGRTRHIISKSGGFGKQTLLTDLIELLQEHSD